MIFKRIITLSSILIVGTGLAACGSKTNNSDNHLSSNASSVSTKKSVANSSSRSASQANQTNRQSTLQNNSSDDSSAYYSSLHQANVDYWNNLSPQEKAQWS